MASVGPCMYCSKRADSLEHILGTAIVDELSRDPRGLPLPMTLHMATRDGPVTRSVRGKRTKQGRYTVEFTTPVCQKCNSGWMNDIDVAARPHLIRMIHGETTTLGEAARANIAAWMTKVAITAYMAIHPGSASKEWRDWIFTNHSGIPDWHIWIAKYVGTHPIFFYPEDISVLAVAADPEPLPENPVVAHHGVRATLVIGYFAAQIIGFSGVGDFALLEVRPGEASIKIWPHVPGQITWPPNLHITDDTLWFFVDRFSQDPTIPPTP